MPFLIVSSETFRWRVGKMKKMGIFNSFFSDHQCVHCSSWDTTTLEFDELEEWRQDMFWEKLGGKGMVPHSCYRCNKCGTIGIKYRDVNDSSHTRLGTYYWEKN